MFFHKNRRKETRLNNYHAVSIKPFHFFAEKTKTAFLKFRSFQSKAQSEGLFVSDKRARGD
jgi:hypothetical protein